MEHISASYVNLDSGYMYEKSELNRKVTIDAVYDRFYETGRIDAFKCNWKEGQANKPHVFWDSDVAKWIEGACNILKKHEDEELLKKVESIIDDIEENQCKDGYFNIYYIAVEPSKKFTQRAMHELYCAGHLMEAAVAYYEATGNKRFLKIMDKYTDYIIKVFVTDDSAEFNTPGHQEIELALVRMYKTTGDKKYLELSKYFIDTRGVREKDNSIDEQQAQSHLPVREQMKAIGHCVRALYMYSAMADLAKEYADKKLLETCKALVDDITNSKMYITGGIGAKRGESFLDKYDLPNETAYAETCAAISIMFFMQRMLKLENKSLYADVIERAFYNGVLSGLSLSGKEFFYENPLSINLKKRERKKVLHPQRQGEEYAITQRVESFFCSCCPPNLNRLLSSLDEYIYGTDNGAYYINQYTSSTMEHDGAYIKQITDYPVSGKVKIECKNVKTLMLRKPYWCDKFEINSAYELVDGYIKIENPTENIEVDFRMKPVLIGADARVTNLNSKAAVCCGPIVYCTEGIDNSDDIFSLFIDSANCDFKVEYDEKFGLNTIEMNGLRRKISDKLYSKYSPEFEKAAIKLIPYSCFANRGETDMAVWINVK